MNTLKSTPEFLASAPYSTDLLVQQIKEQYDLLNLVIRAFKMQLSHEQESGLLALAVNRKRSPKQEGEFFRTITDENMEATMRIFLASFDAVSDESVLIELSQSIGDRLKEIMNARNIKQPINIT